MTASASPLAIIPARRGSKRYPRKNLAPLVGRPLVAWAIDAAKESKIFETIIVSSDDEDVLTLARRAAVTAVQRPDTLAGDEVPVLEVCRHLVRECQSRNPAVYVLLPTTPLRGAVSIRQAWSTFLEHDADVLLSLSKAEYPPQWMLTWEKGTVAPLDPAAYEQTRGNLTVAYRHDGAHLIIRVEHLLSCRPLITPKTVGFASSPAEAVDIDEPLDLAWARFLLQEGLVGKQP